MASRFLQPARRWLRDRLLHAFGRVCQTDGGRQALHDALHDALPAGAFAASAELGPTVSLDQPYTDLPTAAESPDRPVDRDDVVFLSSRFRSGSTFLWNLFRHAAGCTAYYEPFNERRWFDPATRGQGVDSTHRAVDEYWLEYAGLERLGESYDEDWIRRDLFMPADAWNPAMRRYVQTLVDAAPGTPVLQFNRADFRLPWLRRQFPKARIVQLTRHPRDVWCSMLRDLGCCGKDARMRDFEPHDRFYLTMWVRDLKHRFPFLDDRSGEHPYRMAYLLWKLSWLFGRQFADATFQYEDLVTQPRRFLPRLFDVAGLHNVAWEALLPLVRPPEPQRWREYADDAWFRGHEAACEATLEEFFRVPPTPVRVEPGRNATYEEAALATH